MTEANPHYQLIARLRAKGLTVDDYLRMLNEQDQRCGGCGRRAVDIPGKYTPLFVDHNHTTGVVRGLVCSACNVQIGRIEAALPKFQRLIRWILHDGFAGADEPDVNLPGAQIAEEPAVQDYAAELFCAVVLSALSDGPIRRLVLEGDVSGAPTFVIPRPAAEDIAKIKVTLPLRQPAA